MTDPSPAPATPRHELLGRGLFALGLLLVPLGIGAAGGYWLADRGVRWLPAMLDGLLAVGVLALLCMTAGSYLLGPAVGSPRGRRRAIAGSALIVVAAALRVGVHWVAQPSPLTELEPEALAASIREDARRYRELDRGLRACVAALEGRPALWADRDVLLGPDDEQLLLDVWEAYLDQAFALDQVRRFYEDYFRFDLSRLERDRHVQAFLLTYAAELSLFESAAAIVALLERNPNVAKFLDEPHPGRAWGAGSVTAVRETLLGAGDLSRVVAGARWLDYLDRVHAVERELRATPYGWLAGEVRRRHAAIAARGGLALDRTVESDLAPLGRRVKGFTFPVQTQVAEWMGDTRVRRAGRYLIGPTELAALEPALRPGDVLLGRKNWYLSNVGLPGFWPHAILYVGSREQLAADLDPDPGVRAWVRERCGQELAFTEYLARAHPLAWQALAAPGSDLRVIEAVSEGVLQNSLEHCAGDYLAALRPRRLPAWARARAIDRAMSYLGRPYDFDFDFATEHALVCTEVVWRSYRPEADGPGLLLPTRRVAGRTTLPAHDIARLFRDEHGREDAQLEFVSFIEGREGVQQAAPADESAFLATAERSKWDVAQR